MDMNNEPSPSDLSSQIKFWLDSAIDNMKTAESLLRSKRYNFSMFMCQQTIEAILKCVFIKLKGDRPPYIHKLPRLLTLSEINVPNWADEIILNVDAHYIKARYFNDRFNLAVYNRKNAAKIIGETRRVLKWFIKECALKK